MSETGDDKSQQTRRRQVGYNQRNTSTNTSTRNANNNRNMNVRYRPKLRTRGPTIQETELASQLVQIQSKRFYIDAKENERGRFFKLAEVSNGGRKSRILLSITAALEFKTKLQEFCEANEKLPPHDPKERTQVDAETNGDKPVMEGVLKSDMMIKDQKRYFLDLKENERGRFLRVSMVMTRIPRAQIGIPAEGLHDFKQVFEEILTKYNNLTDEDLAREANALSLAESQALKTDNKTFYFDIGSNPRGRFLKISELRINQYKTSITIPCNFIETFRDHLTQFIDKSEEVNGVYPDANIVAWKYQKR